MAAEIVAGATIFTSDGKELGKVKEVEPTAFRVDAPRALDYWLENSLVAEATAARVTLSIADSELGGYKMDKPFDHNGFREAPPASLDRSSVQADALRRAGRGGL
ncbi:MAG: hypothetical protein AB7J35_00200 [Dehalococcoidia bacterium]